MRWLFLLLLVSGCAAQADGNELGGVSKWYGVGPASALQAANDHCARYHRTARPVQTDMLMGAVTFSCERS